ncbi:MAG: hypothetical protein EP332_07055 [Bacteroidetes bacterium]|nr:MAG: hypothetical protein EP332_07055 [Bacteroidota bacterium]
MAKDFLYTNINADPTALAFKSAGKFSFDVKPLIELIRIYQRSEKKLPVWTSHQALFTRKAYEQCSSEAAAVYKAKQMKGRRLLNLSGGIGVDDWALAQSFDEVVSVELDEEVHALATYNLTLLGATNVQRVCSSAEAFLANYQGETFDWIYLDPDRRPEASKVAGLEESMPSVPQLWPSLRQWGKAIWVKASPLIGIPETLQLILHFNEVQVMGIGGEVKEVNLIYKPDNGRVVYKAMELEPEMVYTGDEVVDGQAALAKPENYFYEAHAGLIKAGLCKNYNAHFALASLIPSGAFATSAEVMEDYFGRAFQVIEQGIYKKKSFDQYLKSKNIKKANLNKRHFPESVEQLRKKHKLSDGGSDYFFFYSDAQKSTRFIHGMKLSV